MPTLGQIPTPIGQSKGCRGFPTSGRTSLHQRSPTKHPERPQIGVKRHGQRRQREKKAWSAAVRPPLEKPMVPKGPPSPGPTSPTPDSARNIARSNEFREKSTVRTWLEFFKNSRAKSEIFKSLGAKLQLCKSSGAKLQLCKSSGANLQLCKSSGANLQLCKNSGAKLQLCNILGPKFKYEKFKG